MNRKDLTKGPVFGTMFFFALPMICGNMLQQAYNMVDTWVVGRYVSSGALAAVGAAFALMTFLTSIVLGLSMGSGVVFSRCFGGEDEQGLCMALQSSLILLSAAALLLTALPLLGRDLIIRWLRVPEELRQMMREYLTIIFCGMPAMVLYNFFAAYRKAVGDSVTPLVFLGISTALNICLDLLLVAVLGWGIAGAAAATVFAQYVAGVGLCSHVLRKNPAVRTALVKPAVSLEGLREIANYSVMTCLQQSVMNLGILMVQGLVNSFGTTVMAAFAAAVKVDAFAYMPAQEYGNAFSTFLAQNAGAQKKERISEGIRCAAATSLSYCAVASCLLWFAAKPLMRIFVDASEAEIIAQGVRYLHIEGAFYCGIGGLFLLYGLYRALGRPGISLLLTVISLGTRVALSYSISRIPEIGVVGIWWSIPIGWALADAVGVAYYRYQTRIGNLSQGLFLNQKKFGKNI